MKHLIFFLVVTVVNVVRLGTGVYWELPEIALMLLFIYAIVMGRMTGGFMALAVGLIEDAMIGKAIGIYAVSYLIVVYLIGYLATHKPILGSTVNLFGIFVFGSVVYELLFWIVSELVFAPQVSFLMSIDLFFVILIVVQSILGVIMYPLVRGLLIKGGYLFKY